MSKTISCSKALFKILDLNKKTSSNVICLYFRFLDTKGINLKVPCKYSHSYRLCNVKNDTGFKECVSESDIESLLTKKLTDTFQCSPKEVASIIRKCPDLVVVPFPQVNSNVQLMKEEGLSKDTLIKYPWILTQMKDLPNKVECIKKLHHDVNVTAPFLQIPLFQLRRLSHLAGKEYLHIPERHRISYISQRLKCTPSDVSKVASKHTYILTMPFDRIEMVLDILLDYEVPTQAILSDPWVFRYKSDQIEDRFQRAKEAGINPLKPWLVRCPEYILVGAMQRHIDCKLLLGEHTSVTSYLCQRLACSEEMVQLLSQKTPHMLKVNVPKLKKVLDFLYKEGFTPQQVCQVPRVMYHSIDTMQSRLKTLRDLGYTPNTLMILCYSKRQFSELLKKLVARKEQGYPL